jgi:hypothetical protein
MDLKASIHQDRKKLISDIRKYVRSQKEEWCRVPWLALQADGRIGYSGHYQSAYTYGFWGVQFDGTGPFIDCATGELVSNFQSSPLYNEGVLTLANDLDALTAAKVIRDLQHAASEKIPSWSNQKEFDERAEWRKKLIHQLELQRLYSRVKKRRAA